MSTFYRALAYLVLSQYSYDYCKAVWPTHMNAASYWQHPESSSAPHHVEVKHQNLPMYPDMDYYQSILRESQSPSPTNIVDQATSHDFDLGRLDEAMGDNDIAHPLYIDESTPTSVQLSNLPTDSAVAPIEVSEYYNLEDLSPKPHPDSQDMVHIDNHSTASPNRFDPDSLFQDDSVPDYIFSDDFAPNDSAPATEQDQIEARRDFSKAAARDTSFWKSLARHRKKKGEIIDKYCSITLLNSKPITRAAATKRLRHQCTEIIARNLLSNDTISVQAAKMSIDYGEKWTGHFLPESEKAQLEEVLIRHYRAPLLTAQSIVVRGFRALPMVARLNFAMGKKDIKTLTAFAAKIHQAYFRLRKMEYRRNYGYPCVNKKSDNDSHDNELIGLSFALESLQEPPTNYWMLLSDHQREVMMQRYSSLTNTDIDEAWCKLCAQCNETITTALLSDDIRSQQYAVALLEKVYNKEGDVLTCQEREQVYQQLDKMYGVKKESHRKRAINIGLRNLDEENKRNIREDVRMDNDRFKELATTIWKSKQAFDHRWYLNKKNRIEVI